MASNIITLNSYTRGASNVRGDFLLSTNDPNDCYTGGTSTTTNPDQFIPESKNINAVTVDAGCGCVNDYVKFWYPIYGALDGGAIYYSPSNTTGYSKVVSKVTNANTLTRSLEGTVTPYTCGYSHCNLNISGSFSGEISDIRNSVYQPVGYLDCRIDAGATFYTPNSYLTVSQGSSIGSSAPLGYSKNQGNLLMKGVYGTLYYKFIYYPIFNTNANGGVLVYDMTLGKSDDTTLYSGGTWTGTGIANSNNTAAAYNATNQLSVAMTNFFLNPTTYYSTYTNMILFPAGGGFNGQCLPTLTNTLGNVVNYSTAWAGISDFFRNLTYTYELTCPV
ncbi:MAG: hypothetical protein EBU90_00295 [Proteobacteria bacterium]|nr:hypothetical protein [Pseudomonadota bacterium]NBP12871.1 hypothetical protein [bacterium]